VTYFQVVPGQEVESAHMNAAIRQGAPPFANAAARNAAIPAPVLGQLCYLEDVKQGQVWEGGLWRPMSGIQPWGSIAYSAASAPSGVSRLSVTGLTAAGPGITVSGGYLVVAEPGLYLASAWASTAAAGYASPQVKNEANGAKVIGTYGQGHAAGSQHLAVGLLNIITAGSQIGLYVACDTAKTVSGQLDLVWQGRAA
jgi:hypothetical protein